MPERDHYAQGVPSWVDLTTSDFEAAKRFYTALFGWDCQDQESDAGPYALALQRGEPVAGIYQTQGDGSMWNTYIAVDDADATAKAITDAGGRILMEPFDVQGSGRMAMAADPTGAVFGIWQAGNHIGARVVNEHGALNWNELTTNDTAAAIDFYEKVFGYEVETTETPGGRDYHMFKVNDRGIAGTLEPAMPEMPNSWGCYFAVDDVAEIERLAKDNGGSVIFGPLEAPEVGTFLGLTDPTGSDFTVIQLASPVD